MTLAPHSLETDPTYFFRYTIFDVIVQIKQGHIIAKMGMKTHVIPIDDLEYMYKRHIRQQGVYELTLAFNRDHKMKRARLYSDLHQEGFDSLWSHLQWSKPEADISHLNEREAYAQMGSHDLPWVVIPSLMAIGVLLLALIGAPLLMHGLDRGSWDLNLHTIYQSPELLNNPQSHNVSFSGHLDLERSLQIIEGKGKDQKKHLIIPLYPPLSASTNQSNQENTASSDEVLIALSLRGRGLNELDKLMQGGESRGILRNIWWEGLGHQARRSLIGQGVTLSPKLCLIEVGVKRRDDLQLYLTFVGLFTGLTLLAALYLKPVKYTSYENS